MYLVSYFVRTNMFFFLFLRFKWGLRKVSKKLARLKKDEKQCSTRWTVKFDQNDTLTFEVFILYRMTERKRIIQFWIDRKKVTIYKDVIECDWMFTGEKSCTNHGSDCGDLHCLLAAIFSHVSFLNKLRHLDWKLFRQLTTKDFCLKNNNPWSIKLNY